MKLKYKNNQSKLLYFGKSFNILINKHKLLLNNDDFLNNQNYVLGSYLKAKVYEKYKKKSNFTKYFHYYLSVSVFVSLILFFYGLSKINVFLMLFSIFLPFLLIIYKELSNYYKKFNLYLNYYLKDKLFVGKKFVFRKKIREKINRKDYIIFKK